MKKYKGVKQLDKRIDVCEKKSAKGVFKTNGVAHVYLVTSLCFFCVIIPSGFNAKAALNLGTNHHPLSFLGKTAQTELTKLVVKNLFDYLNKAVVDVVRDNIIKKQRPVRFARVRPYVIRSSAHFSGSFWNENERIKEINIKESGGELIDDLARSWTGTGFLQNTNSSNGGEWMHKSKFDDYDLIQGDENFAPKVFMDGEEYTEQAFFKDRNFSLYHFKKGRTEESQFVTDSFGNHYNIEPGENYTFEGQSLNWQASYHFIVDTGLANNHLDPNYNFRKSTTLPVRIFYQLADIDLGLVKKHNNVKELQILLRKQKNVQWKDKNPSCLKEGKYRAKLLARNTQLLRNKCYGEGLAYEMEVETGLQFWKKGPIKYFEDFLDPRNIQPVSVKW